MVLPASVLDALQLTVLLCLPSPMCCTAADYMVLPASQYSVLDARRIERLDSDTFRCHVGGLRFLGLEVEPVITVSVVVGERGPTVRLLGTQVGGCRWWAGWVDRWVREASDCDVPVVFVLPGE